MIKLRKFLKPYLLGVFVAVLLLFGQAFVDLNLPNYMSNIVNTGIQQSGIEHTAPSVISENGLTLMRIFMTEEERQWVESAYTLTAVDAVVGHTLNTDLKYVYVKNQDDLDTVFAQASWTMISYFMAQGDGSSSGDSIDVTALYELLPLLETIPASVVNDLRAGFEVDASIMMQSGTVLTKSFYTELGIDLAAIQQRYIFSVGLSMLGISLLGGIATVLISLLASRIAAGVGRDLRHAVFEKIESFSNEEFDTFSTASLITRCTNDINQIQTVVGFGVRMIIYAPIMAVGGTIMALRQSLSMAWIIGLACLILMCLIGLVIVIVMPRFKKMQELVDGLNLVVREGLSGLMVIRAFATQDHEKKRFEKANTVLANTSRFVNRAMNTMMPSMGLIMNGVSLLIVWVGGHQIANSSMQVGDMIAFIQYAMQIIMSFLMMTMMFIFLPRAAVSAERIVAVLETKASIIDPKDPQSYPEGAQGVVTFNKVSFRYGDSNEDTVANISFTANPGETTAIIGSTGSGKSTLIQLLLRFYDVSEGEILVDGLDVRAVNQHDLRERIGYVPQKGVLLSGTIESNLRYGKADVPFDKIEEAARVAQSEGFILAKEEGYHAQIAQGGSNVSGGQKQRLSIARAIVKDPDIYIFDDSFSALDFKTDKVLRQELKAYTGDKTLIIVAQRVNTILDAEKILVMDEGRIVGMGRHEELLHTCPEYYEIASSQLSEEELLK